MFSNLHLLINYQFYLFRLKFFAKNEKPQQIEYNCKSKHGNANLLAFSDCSWSKICLSACFFRFCQNISSYPKQRWFILAKHNSTSFWNTSYKTKTTFQKAAIFFRTQRKFLTHNSPYKPTITKRTISTSRATKAIQRISGITFPRKYE